MPYTAVVVISAIYLLWGFCIETRALLKAAIAIQILGDLAFSAILQNLPVFRFIKSLTEDDKFIPLLLLMGCVVAMDLGAVLVGPRRSKDRTPLPPQQFDTKRGRTVGYILVAIALTFKLIALAASGISSINGILTWQPEDLVGFAFLDIGSSLAFPLGCALVAMSQKKPAHMKAIVAIIAFGILSPWKGSPFTMSLLYGLAVSHFGAKQLKAIVWSKRTVAIVAILAVMLSIKAQYRNLGEASTDPESLLLGLVGGTSVRFMGGNFQTYAYAFNSAEAGAPLMDGEYNAQALYMWIPRQLWSDKPRFAGEQIYDYLDFNPLADEPYGTSAFAVTVFGTFYIDFGKYAALICSFVLGIGLGIGNRLILRLRKQGIKYVALSTIWLYCALSLSEAGLPGMVPILLCGVGIVYLAIAVANILLWPAPQCQALKQFG